MITKIYNNSSNSKWDIKVFARTFTKTIRPNRLPAPEPAKPRNVLGCENFEVSFKSLVEISSIGDVGWLIYLKRYLTDVAKWFPGDQFLLRSNIHLKRPQRIWKMSFVLILPLHKHLYTSWKIGLKPWLVTTKIQQISLIAWWSMKWHGVK